MSHPTGVSIRGGDNQPVPVSGLSVQGLVQEQESDPGVGRQNKHLGYHGIGGPKPLITAGLPSHSFKNKGDEWEDDVVCFTGRHRPQLDSYTDTCLTFEPRGRDHSCIKNKAMIS